jgi:hypothetical protein
MLWRGPTPLQCCWKQLRAYGRCSGHKWRTWVSRRQGSTQRRSHMPSCPSRRNHTGASWIPPCPYTLLDCPHGEARPVVAFLESASRRGSSWLAVHVYHDWLPAGQCLGQCQCQVYLHWRRRSRRQGRWRGTVYGLVRSRRQGRWRGTVYGLVFLVSVIRVSVKVTRLVFTCCNPNDDSEHKRPQTNQDR